MSAWNPPDPEPEAIGPIFREADPFDGDANALIRYATGLAPRDQVTREEAEAAEAEAIPF